MEVNFVPLKCHIFVSVTSTTVSTAARLGKSANIRQEQEEENCVLEAFITTLLACLTAMELEQTTDPTHLKLLLLKEVHWIVHNILPRLEGSI